MKKEQPIVLTPKELLAELQSLISEANTMMASSLSEHSAEALENLRARFSLAQDRLSEFYVGAKKQVIASARQTDTTIRENPYQSIAVALGVGLVFGLLLRRRNA